MDDHQGHRGGHTSCVMDASRSQRKLVLHFDIRNTILVADSVTNIGVEESLNSYLTGVTWGHLDQTGRWAWDSDIPTLNTPVTTPPNNNTTHHHPPPPPHQHDSKSAFRIQQQDAKNATREKSVKKYEHFVHKKLEHRSSMPSPTTRRLIAASGRSTMTYYKYMEAKLVRNPTDRVNLRQKTGNFTSEELGQRFEPYFTKHLDLLRWTDPGTSADKLLTMPGRNSSTPYHYILPAFYRLLNYLTTTHRDFTVVIRTYGMDAPNVLRSIAHAIQGNHPEVSKPLDIHVNRKPGRIDRHGPGGKITLELPAYINGVCKPAVKLDNEHEMYRTLCEMKGIHAFVDDFVTWQNHQYSTDFGKPLWIDLDDKHTHHIFFDDNIRVNEDDSIVDVRPSDPEVTAKYLENACLVQADLLTTISNPDYFIEKVQNCEKNYRNLLCQLGKQQ